MVQNKREGKHVVILGYYVKNTDDFRDFKHFVLCGCMSEEEISKYPIQYAGTKTRHATVSQIDNYCTKLKDYSSLDDYIKNFMKECDKKGTAV